MDIAVGSKDRIPRMVVTDGGAQSFCTGSRLERALEASGRIVGDSRGAIFSVQLAELRPKKRGRRE